MQLSLMLHSQPVLKTEVDLNQRDWFKMGSVTADFSLFGKIPLSHLFFLIFVFAVYAT